MCIRDSDQGGHADDAVQLPVLHRAPRACHLYVTEAALEGSHDGSHWPRGYLSEIVRHRLCGTGSETRSGGPRGRWVWVKGSKYFHSAPAKPSGLSGRPAGSETRSRTGNPLSLIHISEPTRLLSTSYAVFC